jgi:L-rhamnose-H+ transport protein
MPAGLMLVVFAGLMNGSFATPMKGIRGWQWEHTWLVWSVTGLVVLPACAALATVVRPWHVYAAAAPESVGIVVLFGSLWGISSILFGLGVSRVGLAIGFGVIIGISSILGSLVPLIFLHPEALWRPAGLLTMLGVLLLGSGVASCAIAGRSRGASIPVTRGGLAICVLSGLGAPMVNFGLAFGAGIVASAEKTGTAPMHALNAIWPLLLSGAFLSNAGYCLYLMRRKSGFQAFGQPRAAANFALSALMGALWMGSNLAYGYGTSRLGPLGLVLGWPIMMACVVLTANGWGVATGEWRNAKPRSKGWIAAGVLLLVAGVAVIGSAAM